MEKDVQLYSLTKYLLTFLITVNALTGCSTPARDLPNDYGSVDAVKRLNVDDFDITTATLTCAEVNDELRALENANKTQIQTIKGNRTHNQATGYIGGVFFLPVYLATDNDLDAKEKIRNINRAKDELYKYKAFKKCPSLAVSQL